MAWTSNEEARIEQIEQLLNRMQTALNNLASKQQLKALSVLKEKDINDLITRVVALENQVALLIAGS